MTLSTVQMYQAQIAIDQYLDEEIIPSIDNLLERTRALHSEHDMSNSQLSSLLNIANSTGSTRTVINWIKYQMGRPNSFAWSGTRYGDRFGSALISELETLQQTADSIIQTIAPELEEQAKSRAIREVYMVLIRHYAGLLRRSIVADKERR